MFSKIKHSLKLNLFMVGGESRGRKVKGRYDMFGVNNEKLSTLVVLKNLENLRGGI